MTPKASQKIQPVVSTIEEFDRNSGSLIERAFFNHRRLFLAVCLAITVVLGFSMTNLKLNASFEKTIPTHHPYVANYLKHKNDLGGLGNVVRLAVETTGPSIYDKEYLATLQKISDEIFLMPGVERAYVKSLWTPSTMWRGVTEEGFEAGPVIPNDYDGSSESVAQVRRNVDRSGELGTLVALNSKSSIVYVPLLPNDADSNRPLDYGKLSRQLEQIRDKYQSPTVKIHITGFAKVLGDLIGALRWFLLFFAAAILIDAGLRQYYIRCWRSTGLMVACSLIAVVWQLGLLALLGYELDPYSILVPFLIFSIGMSHGSQKMNGIMQDIGRGTHRVVAARYTFRRLFLPGLTALLADAVGFIVLLAIRIQVIQDLAVTSSIGVAILIFTNLILLPICLSFTGVNGEAALRSLSQEKAECTGAQKNWFWRFLDLFTRRKWAAVAIAVCAVMAAGGLIVRENLKIGDLDPGAPELRPTSRYNRDNAFLNANYGASSDVLAVMVETPDGACTKYDTLMRLDALEWALRQVPGVESTNSLALSSRQIFGAYSEGSMKWYDLPRNQDILNTIAVNGPRGVYNETGNLLTLYVYLSDHKADTLTRVVNTVETFAAENDTKDAKFILGAGTAGIDAATNIVVKKATHEMLYWVYGAVILLCFITFRSWRAVVVAVLPLMLTSILCEALMVWLGMGVKVATLPVIALGVGIGVDYALYIVSVVLGHLKAGESLSTSYYNTLCFTGRVVVLTGLTLAFGVATWAFSPIKFQADVGVLLVFMFVWNMLGALILLPALATFLLLPQKKAMSLAARETEPVEAAEEVPI
ncbi:MAG: MMPL family transporter [Desulfuromonadaceae bacterium]|nr:MMPL family transporter [Desulfuromonadaceae bacterium]